MKAKPYSKCRPSGVGWLGDVPEHWKVKRFQRCVYVAEGQVDPEVGPYSGMLLIAPNHVEAGTGNLIVRESASEQQAESGKYFCKSGDVIYSKIRPALRKACIAPEDCLCSADMYPLRAYGGVSNRYLRWFILSDIFSSFALLESERVAMPKINRDSLKEISIPCPPISEQEAISSFLAEKTGRIDELIGKKEWLIELLKEKRTATISHAVTRGLDPNAKTKESDIGWLGRIPAHWKVKRFQRCVFVAEGQVDPEVEPYSQMLLIAPNHIETGTGNLIMRESASEQHAESGKYFCRSGDVVYSKIRPALRKACIAPEDCLCSADMYPLRAFGGVTNRYLFWFTLSDVFSSFAVLESGRVAMPKINRESLKEIVIPVPAPMEQEAIAECLDRETRKIDALIEKVESAIESLKEYRTAIISAAVTGKIDVREGADT